MLPNSTYYAKELKAPTGYSLDNTVYAIKSDETVDVKESPEYGKIIINKTAEDGIISGREFKVVNNTTGESWTEKTDSKGIAVFGDDNDEQLYVYDLYDTKKTCSYTISEINVDTRYEIPKAQNVKLTDGDVDLTVNVNF